MDRFLIFFPATRVSRLEETGSGRHNLWVYKHWVIFWAKHIVMHKYSWTWLLIDYSKKAVENFPKLGF